MGFMVKSRGRRCFLFLWLFYGSCLLPDLLLILTGYGDLFILKFPFLLLFADGSR